MPFKGRNIEPLTDNDKIALMQVEDHDALGTLKNPLRWADGNEVAAEYHHTDGTHLYVALKDGVPTGIEDETYFTEV